MAVLNADSFLSLSDPISHIQQYKVINCIMAAAKMVQDVGHCMIENAIENKLINRERSPLQGARGLIHQTLLSYS